MNIFDMIKPFLKGEGLTEEQIDELEQDTSKPRKFEDLPEWMQQHQIIRDCQNKWIEKTKILAQEAEQNNFQNMQLEEMPLKNCIEIHSYYFYLVSLKQNLYKYRTKDFKVIKLLYDAIHTIIDKWDILKENLILTEMIRIKTHNYNKPVENLREKAEEQINKIKFENFITQSNTIDFLYERALKEKD